MRDDRRHRGAGGSPCTECSRGEQKRNLSPSPRAPPGTPPTRRCSFVPTGCPPQSSTPGETVSCRSRRFETGVCSQIWRRPWNEPAPSKKRGSCQPRRVSSRGTSRAGARWRTFVDNSRTLEKGSGDCSRVPCTFVVRPPCRRRGLLPTSKDEGRQVRARPERDWFESRPRAMRHQKARNAAPARWPHGTRKPSRDRRGRRRRRGAHFRPGWLARKCSALALAFALTLKK
jgi:hypothetical protein